MGFFSKLFKKKNKKKEKTPELNTNERKIEAEPKQPATQVGVEQKAPVTTQQKPKAPAPKVKSEVAKPKQQELSQTAEAPRPKPKATKETVRPESAKSGNSGFFEIKKSKDDRYVFNLFASNRVIVATSQVYSSPQSALNGINSVIANAESANVEDRTVKDFVPQNYPKWEIYKDKGGDFRFRLSASNGSCICHSQGYTSKANCKKGIESIIKNTKNAKIEKTYLKKQ